MARYRDRETGRIYVKDERTGRISEEQLPEGRLFRKIQEYESQQARGQERLKRIRAETPLEELYPSKIEKTEETPQGTRIYVTQSYQDKLMKARENQKRRAKLMNIRMAQEFMRPSTEGAEYLSKIFPLEYPQEQIEAAKQLKEASRPMRAIGQMGLGAFEGMTFGVPKLIPEEIRRGYTPENIQERIAKGTGEFYGFTKGPGKLFSSLRNSIVRRMSGGLSSKVLGSTIAGGTVGVLQTPDVDWEQQIPMRTIQGVAGAGLGATGELIVQGVRTSGAGFKAGRQLKRQRPISTVKQQQKELLKMKEAIKTKAEKATLEAHRQAIRDNISVLERQLVRDERIGAVGSRKLLRKFLRGMNRIYGKKQAEYSAKGGKITLKEARAVLLDSVDEGLANLIPEESAGIKATKKLLETKYSGKLFTKGSKQLVSLEEFHRDINNISNAIKAERALIGARGFTHSETYFPIVRSRYGELLGKRFPEMIPLNRDYSQVKDLSKKVYRIFKPTGSETDVDQAVNFFRRVGAGNKRLGEEIFTNLMKGSRGRFPREPGIAKYAEKIAGTRKALAAEKSLLKSLTSFEQVPLETTIPGGLPGQRKVTKAIEAMYGQQENVLAVERALIEQLMDNSKKAGQLLRFLRYSAYVAGGLGILRGLRRRGGEYMTSAPIGE